MPNKDQDELVRLMSRPRIFDHEKATLKAVFGVRYELYILLRNILFGFQLTEEEKKLAVVFNSSETLRVIKKILYPELEKDIPIMQNIDLWMTKEFQHLETAADDKMFQKYVDTKKRFLEMVETGLKRVANPDLEGVNLDLLTQEQDFVTVTARNAFAPYVEKQINVILALANSNEESPEEALARLKKDSTR